MLRLRWPFEWVRTIKLRELPDEVAMEEVRRYFGTAETPVYYSDIADHLRLDPEQVVRVCNRLIGAD
jgi:hypothetical protein